MLGGISTIITLLLSASATLASAGLDTAPLAVGGPGLSKRHHELAHRARGDVSLHKREYTNIRATWYGAGMGACGKSFAPTDFIVALSQETFGWSYPSSYCWKYINIEYQGKSARAQIVDSCVACSNYSPWALDFSPSLFEHFADEGLGVIYVDWSFEDGTDKPATTAAAAKKTTKKEEPTPTPKPKPKTTSTKHTTSTHHTTSTTKHTTSTTTSHHTTSTTKHTTSTTTKNTTTSTSKTTSASAVATSPAVSTGNLQNLEQIIVDFDALLYVAVQ